MVYGFFTFSCHCSLRNGLIEEKRKKLLIVVKEKSLFVFIICLFSFSVGAKFQQHSSGRFTTAAPAPINGHQPATTSLKHTLCLQRKHSETSFSHQSLLSQGVVDVGLVKKKESHMKLINSMCLKPDTLTERRQPCTALSVMKSSPVTHRYTAAVPNDHALRLPHPAVWEVHCGLRRDEGHGPVIHTHSASLKPETPGLFSFFPPLFPASSVSVSPHEYRMEGRGLVWKANMYFCAPIRVLHHLNGKSEGAPKKLLECQTHFEEIFAF